jgi:DNA (cytosine-5)-methyltransferase 1
MTSPPCQAFSLAGKRLGKEDKRGILFFNSHEFIQVNKPRYFIFENVRGLISDDNGKTFNEWVNLLGGKSVNGLPVIFPYEESVPYHLYWKVLNAKDHGVPQNRERVFLIGIRDDKDNNFRFPIEERLTKRLKDVLEDNIDEKYYLREASLNSLLKKQDFNKFNPLDESTEYSNLISARCHKVSNDNPFIKVKSATLKGYEEATEGDSINFSVLNSETRRGRVGKGIAQTLDTLCNQAVIQLNPSLESGGKQPYQQNRIFDENGISPAILSNLGGDRNHNILNDYQIRRLTPRECFRLMDFPESFIWTCSDSQAYKQAGNSIVVNVLYKILKNLNL